MNNIDNLNEVSEIKNQFEKLQRKYQTHLPKVDPYFVYDLLLRQQKNPTTMCMYNIEVFTRQGYKCSQRICIQKRRHGTSCLR